MQCGRVAYAAAGAGDDDHLTVNERTDD
jgi:hypothetical protein